MDLTSFLEFWQNQSQSQTPIEDAAQKMAPAYIAEIAKLADLKRQTASFIRPINNGKAWVVGFDPDKIQEVATIGNGIDETSRKIKSISNDITAFLELSEGRPTLTAIVHERNQHKRRVLATEKHAATALKRALDKDPHTSPAVLMQRADIAEAYTAMNRAKEETAAPISDLTDKLEKMRKIIAPYETV